MRSGRRLLAGAAIATTVLATAATGATGATGAGTTGGTPGTRGTPGAAAARAASAAGTRPVFTGATVSPDHVAVHGLDLVPVTVTLTFSDTYYGDPDDVLLDRTTTGAWDRSAPRTLIAPLARTSGSGSSGTFAATVQVPSTAHGTWFVAGALWRGGPAGNGAGTRADGIPDAILTVTGTHRPRIRFSVSPQPLPYPQTRATERAVVTFDDTGAPVPGFAVAFGLDNRCADRGAGPDALVRTDRHGLATHPIWVLSSYTACAWAPLADAGSYESFPGRGSLMQVVLLGTRTSASPSRRSAPRRSAVAVTGRVLALTVPVTRFGGPPVALQRRVGHHWRTVGTGNVRDNARFTLTANPPRGRNLYRVQLRGNLSYASSTSRTFTVTGT